MTTNTAKKSMNVINNIDEVKEELVSLLMACAVLPVSKVEGKDFRGKKGERGGLKELYKQRQDEAKALFAGDMLAFSEFMNEVAGEFTDRLQRYNDEEDELFKNEDVDDLTSRFEKIEAEAFHTEWVAHFQAENSVKATAEEAQKRHCRMVTRLAIVRKLQGIENEEERREMLALVNDDLAERVLNEEYKFDKTLEPFAVYRKDFMNAEVEVLLKNQHAYRKSVLEERAKVLRSISMRAEEMMLKPGFKPTFAKIGGQQVRTDFVGLAINLCNQTKTWAENQLNRPEKYELLVRKPIQDASKYHNKVVLQERTKVTCFRRYSLFALMALYNEAVSGLNALGVFKSYFPKTMKGHEPSFFFSPTRKGMVDVKTGADWSDELRNLYYEVDDGTGRTPVRNSGLDG